MMGIVPAALSLVLKRVLDFALPPRCGGCGAIVDDVHSFCPGCWRTIQFLGDSGCVTCGLPLEATEADACAACLAAPPRIARARAVAAYDELTRGIVIRLKYGRKVALARTMARFMARLIAVAPGDKGEAIERVLIPVPLHRSRLWQRGFNQSALVAAELSRRCGLPARPFALRRTRRTPPLKGMTMAERRRTVGGAFAVADPRAVRGKVVVLVDDVFTTGSTAEACAKALQRAGASRVELVSWVRVVRPARLSA